MNDDRTGRGAAIVVRDVHKDFDGGVVRALRGVDLDVLVGEWVAVVGPSGCGKSTLLHLLAALDSPTSGRVRVLDHDLAALDDPARYRRSVVGLVFQLHNLVPHLTAAQNVEIALFGTHRSRGERRRRALELLADVDLAGLERRQPTRLSGGERQRVAIARALANNPPVVLADEPTGSLDTASATRVTGVFERLRDDRPELTIVMVTHDPRVAARADRVIEMCDGIVVGGQAATART
ncbi:MAG TPA: ABC transporter ATP-binding protein [Jatrophihabitans sp.]